MALNPSIILAGQQPNFLKTLGNAAVTAGQTNDVMQQNALRGFLRDNGQAVMAGERNALDRYAQFSPEAALGVQETRQGMLIREEQLQMARAAAARAAASAQNKSQVQQEIQQAANGLRQAAIALKSGDERGWAQTMQAFGAGSLPMDPSSLELIAATISGLDEGMRSGIVDAVTPDVPAFRTISGDEAAQLGLDPNRAYNVGRDGKITGIGGGDTNVTVNTGDGVDPRPITDKPPKGFQRRWDEERQTYVDEPIPGSAVAAESEGDSRKMQLAVADYDRKFNIVDSSINKALRMLKESGRFVAGYGALLSGLPESAARDFQATVDTIKANLGFEELQAMRDSSPTGGALGQVTEREIAFLQAIQGNLDTAQSPEQLKSILQDIQQRRREFANERRRIMGGAVAPANDGPPEGVDPDLWQYLTPEERALFK